MSDEYEVIDGRFGFGTCQATNHSLYDLWKLCFRNDLTLTPRIVPRKVWAALVLYFVHVLGDNVVATSRGALLSKNLIAKVLASPIV